MNNYTVNYISGTFSPSLSTLSGVLIAGMLTTLPINNPAPDTRIIRRNEYVINSTSATFDQYSSSITGKFTGSVSKVIVTNLEETIVTLYDHLRKIQEPLGADFQKVLDDNLSELLARW